MPPKTTISKAQTWTLILLSWTAALSLIAVGLLLTQGSSTGLSKTEISAACQNGTINGVTTNLTRIAEACNAEITEVPDQVIPGTYRYPGFSVPFNWHVAGSSYGDLSVYSIQIADEPIVIYNWNSDAPSVTKLWMSSQVIPTEAVGELQKSYVDSTFADASFKDPITTSDIISNGTLYTTHFTELSEMTGERPRVYHHFFGTNTMVTLTYYNDTPEVPLDKIISSLDWSTVK